MSDDKKEAISAVISQALQGILGLEPADIEYDTEFIDIGLDSINAAKLHTVLEEKLGDDYQLEMLDVFNSSDIDELSGKILAKISS